MRCTVSTLLLVAALVVGLSRVSAAGLDDAAAVPHLDAHGLDAYRQFLAAPTPRAFAIAPGGTWGWSAEAESPDLAEKTALANCQANTLQTCMTYALDNRVVFNAAAWSRAWGPYLTGTQAARAKVGMLRGERFPNLQVRDAAGKRLTLGDLRGQVVVLHFWGSWCPPCQREMPDLAKLTLSMKQDKSVRFLFLQVREDFSTASNWANKIAKRLPLYDSGMRQRSDSHFVLADGSRLADRTVAMAFPTTYVLDRNGVVVFSHVGPVSHWSQYQPLLRDVASRSGSP